MSSRIFCLLLAVSLACLTNYPAMYAQTSPKDKPMVDKILADWQARFKAVNSIEYVVTGTIKYFSENKNNPDDDLPHKYEILFEVSTGKIKIKRETSKIEQNETVIWDGDFGQLFTTEERTFLPKKNCHRYFCRGSCITSFDINLLPMFAAHGLFAIGDEPSLRYENLKMREEGFDDIKILDRTTFKDRNCLLLTTNTSESLPSRKDNIWVSTKDDSALLRYQLISAQRLLYDIQIDYQTISDRSLPKSWTIEVYQAKSYFKNSFQVESIKINPLITKEDFSPSIKQFERVAYLYFPKAKESSGGYAYYCYEFDENLKPILVYKNGYYDNNKQIVFPGENFDWIPNQKSTKKGNISDWRNLSIFLLSVFLIGVMILYFWYKKRKAAF